MPLIVEDGTGLANAESYLSVADLKSYADARGRSYAGKADTALENALRIATNYVDTKWRYKGDRATALQALEFPRTSLIDWSGYSITGIPGRLKNATAELALKSLTDDINADQDRGGKVVSESVGSVSISYAADAPAGRVYTLAMGFLQPYIRDGSVKGSPRFGGGTEGYFEFGMHDHPSEATGLTE